MGAEVLQEVRNADIYDLVLCMYFAVSVLGFAWAMRTARTDQRDP